MGGCQERDNTFVSYLERVGVQEFGGLSLQVRGLEEQVHEGSVRGDTLHERALLAVWRALRDCPLIGAHCSRGVFCHLGTSWEMQQLLLSPPPHLHPQAQSDLQHKGSLDIISDQTSHSQSLSKLRHKLVTFQRKFNLKAYVRSLCGPSTALASRTCITNSFLACQSAAEGARAAADTGRVVVGVDSVIENSFLHGKSEVGEGCVVSGVQPVLGYDLVLPPGLLLQQVPLARGWRGLLPSDGVGRTSKGHEDREQGRDEDGAAFCVLLTLGMHDDVKAVCSPHGRGKKDDGGFCGKSWEGFFAMTGGLIGPSDIWDDSTSERSLWTAQLFLVLRIPTPNFDEAVDGDALLKRRSAATWFWAVDRADNLTAGEKARLASLVMEWRAGPRLSMAQLLRCGSAVDMALWKRFLLGVYGDLRRAENSSDPVRAVQCGSLKMMLPCHCMRISTLFAQTNSTIQVVRVSLSAASSAKTFSDRRLEQEAASMTLALLVIRLCRPGQALCPSSSSAALCQHVSLFMADVWPDPHSFAAASVSMAQQQALQTTLHAVNRLCDAVFDAPLPSPISPTDTFNPTSWLLAYLIRLVDLHSPSATLWRLLRACSCPAPTSSSPVLIAPANLPRLLLLLLTMAKFGIVVRQSADHRERDCRRRVQGGELEYYISQCSSTENTVTSLDQGSRLVLANVFNGFTIRQQVGEEEPTLATCDLLDKVLAVEADLLGALQQLVRFHLGCGTAHRTRGLLAGLRFSSKSSLGSSASASAPFRIDLAGGWSDTPPITYEYAGSVINLAVDILDYDEVKIGNIECTDARAVWQPSLHCSASFIAEPVVRLTSRTKSPESFSRGGTQGGEYSSVSITCTTLEDFQVSSSDSTAPVWTKPGALLRACVITLGLLTPPSSVTPATAHSLSLAEALRGGCGGRGLHLQSTSSVPVGSGMGSSSILIAVVIRAIWHLLQNCGNPWSLPAVESSAGAMMLVDLVGQTEQLLRTGGGWQDQVGGVFGGIKACSSSGVLPLTVRVHPLQLTTTLLQCLEKRMLLVYSGVARVARDTLLGVLCKHSQQPPIGPSERCGDRLGAGLIPDIVSNAHSLLQLLESPLTRDCTTFEQADEIVDAIAAHVGVYWEQKKALAAGTETPLVRRLMDRLGVVCSAASACGAGAGGFIVCFLRRSATVDQLAAVLKHAREDGATVDSTSLHPVRVNMKGVVSTVIPTPQHTII
mmetsp:Transcript_18186/g.34051  ORF Transcript_18186/g.34051 Transcript_18186/m.34051 type:complete len:1213 (-) Transcript_18186:57-3695(-)